MMKSPFREIVVSVLLFFSCSAAFAEFVVVVNPKSTVANVTKDQIAQCFLGSTNNFSPVDQADGTSIRIEFYKGIADKDPSQVRAIWSKLVFTGKAKPPKQVANSEEVKKLVASDINAIGYIEKSAVDASVKVVYPPN